MHLKDGDTRAIRALQRQHAPTDDLWRGTVFCRLGAGDFNCRAVLDALHEIGYQGWLVVEQDIFPEIANNGGQAARDQKASRSFLSELGPVAGVSARRTVAGRRRSQPPRRAPAQYLTC